MKHMKQMMHGISMAAGALLLTTAASAQTAAGGGRSVMSGVYSTEQAERGRNAHAMNCTSCHDSEAYTGQSFVNAWRGRSAFDFFEQIRTTMPDDNPGLLKREEYLDVTAYVLSLNGFPAGAQPLPDDDEALKQVKIDSFPAAPGAPADTTKTDTLKTDTLKTDTLKTDTTVKADTTVKSDTTRQASAIIRELLPRLARRR